ncbi:MAG: hypothetical protein LBD57_01485 [Endomicrobium sp.]|jgi:tetratricopeptide (TPR) repeat protein|uniref:tetratricopeptide repeat protein n=1 Tax=Candidatus Endomicrobiellum cubanum TaxID=3242325 RepID=UPI00281FA7A4|nr:hypothetical protein [Endomicrobium sp.]
MKKILLVFIFLSFTNVLIYADKLFFKNYDAQSSAMGNSIASFSNNSFSFINSPSTNFNFLSKKIDFSFISLPSDTYAGASAMCMPFSFGNVTLAGSYSKDSPKIEDDYLEDNAAALYLNYTLPIFKTCPVYENIGGVGITIKGSRWNVDGISNFIYACDLGAHYKLHMIDDGFFIVMCVRNLSNKTDLKNKNLIEGIENFDFALRYNFKGASSFVLVADVIKFFDNQMLGCACGAEISPISPTTFKFGYTDYNDGYLKGVTAGVFLDFNSFNIGYAFSGINNKEAKHTINMGFMFGVIENENKAYKYYLGVNFVRAKEAYDKKDFINARQMFENILAVYPNHAPSKKYLQKIIYELDVQKKIIELSINKFLRKAQKAYEANNLIKARVYYKEVLGLDTANTQALEGILEINKRLKEIDNNENKEINSKKIVSLWKEGVKFYNEKNFVFAKEKFKEIISIDSKNPGAIRYLNLIETQLSNIISVQTRIVFEQGMQYYNEKNYKEAAKYFSAAYVTNPNMVEAKKYYILSKKVLKQRYDDIELFNKKSLNLIAEDEQTFLQEQKNAKDYYNKALNLIKKNKLESAFAYLDKAYRYVQEEYIAQEKDRLGLRLSEKYYNQGLKAYNLKQKSSILVGKSKLL